MLFPILIVDSPREFNVNAPVTALKQIFGVHCSNPIHTFGDSPAFITSI